MSKSKPTADSRERPSALHVVRGVIGVPLGLAWGLATGLAVVALPGRRYRRLTARWASRGLLRLLGLRLDVSGALELPDGGCVAIANHASYLDGIILTAILPPNFSFVIKREMTNVPLVGLLLRRLDAVFVDRSGTIRGQRDGRHILDRAGDGEAIGIFPEGTFRPEPGLLPFRPGAFITAIRAGRPVVPISIEGSRRALPAERWLPRPTTIAVTIHPPVQPTGKSRSARQALEQACRHAILSGLNESEAPV